MSNGFQLFISEDGSQILFDPTTGKSYALMENESLPINPNYQVHQQNYGQYQNPITVPAPQMHQNMYGVPQTLGIQDNENQNSYPNLMSILPNHIPSPRQTPSQHNIHTRIPPHSQYQQKNTSTPTQTEQEQVNNIETEPRGTEEGTLAMNNNKRSLNDSDEFTIVTSRGQKKKNQRTDGIQTASTQKIEKNNSTPATSTKNYQNQYNVPIEQLQRAVAHNLPCFTIKFSDHEKLPSVVAAAEELYEHFNRQKIKLNHEFSVIRYLGNKLRVGVKDKNDYQTLCNQQVWPKEISNNQISISIPKFVPEQFSLVVRFIPDEVSIDQVEKEVKRSASTANNFRKIIYSYPRKTNDYRFTVADLREYNGLLHLGHIGIGNRMRTVTPYKPANKITYCTKCWVLGHLRYQCQVQTQKCRICLLDYNDTHNQICSKQPKCAQCSLDHLSLDADCQSIQNYRSNLNKAVKQAVQDGAIKPTSSVTAQQTPLPPPNRNNTHYPPLRPSAPTTNAPLPPHG